MKTMRIILTGLLCLILFFSSCSKEKEEEDYVIRVKTVATVCVIHEGVPAGEGVDITVCLAEAGTLVLECQNLSTDESGCTSFVSSYYDLHDYDGMNFRILAYVIGYASGQELGLTFEQASAGAVESDDGHGKIYTWNVNLVLSY